jgi:hypothetical protein
MACYRSRCSSRNSLAPSPTNSSALRAIGVDSHTGNPAVSRPVQEHEVLLDLAKCRGRGVLKIVEDHVREGREGSTLAARPQPCQFCLPVS